MTPKQAYQYACSEFRRMRRLHGYTGDTDDVNHVAATCSHRLSKPQRLQIANAARASIKEQQTP